MTNRQTEYARNDAAMAHSHLFRPIQRGQYARRLVFSLTWKGGTLTFASAYQFGIPEQSLFLAACALCGLGGVTLSANPISNEGQALRRALAPANNAAGLDAISVETSMHELLTAAGMATGGSAYARAENMLWRLSNLTIRFQHQGWDGSMHLLSYVKTPEGKVRIGLHHRLAEAIAGSAQHFRVNLIERRALNSDPAKCLHAWLSGFIRPGESKSIGIDKLTTHIWPDDCSDAEQRKRLMRARHALQEIKLLPGWVVAETNGTVTIGRPDL